MKKYVNGEYIEMTEEEIREIEEAKKQADAERTGAEEDILNKLGGVMDKLTKLEKLAVAPTTDNSVSLHIVDSADYPVLDFGMSGKTEQKQYTGKNLYSSVFSDYTKPYDYYIMPIDLSEGENYAVSCKLVGEKMNGCNVSIVRAGERYSEFVQQQTLLSSTGEIMVSAKAFTIDSTWTDPKLAVYCSGEKQFNEIFKNYEIQLEKSTKVTEYEPYVGVMPSPSPDYPQEIVNAGVLNEDTGKYEIECRIVNENLFDESLIDKTSSSNREVVLNFIKDGQTYVISNDIDGMGVIAVQGIVERGEPKDDEIVVIRNVATTKTFKADLSKYDYYILRYYEPNKNGIHNIMITHQSKMNGYLPHESQVFALTSPVPPTKWDKLVKRDGVWGWSIYHQHYVINGSYEWRVYGDGGRRGFSANCLNDAMSRRDGYCNQLQVDNKGLAPVELRNHIWIGVNNSYVYTLGLEFYNNDLEDKGLANWKKHLNENPLDIWTYRTREIAFHPLPDEEQSLLNNLETYYGVTNVYNDQGCPTWVKYVADTKLYIDNKLANTQALILES